MPSHTFRATFRATSRPTAAAVAAVLAACVVAVPAPVAAGVQHPVVVGDDPSNLTPNVLDGGGVDKTAVYAFQQVGGTMVAGGNFAQIADAGSIVPAYTRSHVFAFDIASGAVTSFAPMVDKPVWAIAHDAATGALYLAGQFTQVNGVARRGVVKLNPTTGAVDTAFNARLVSGKVTDMKLVNGRLFVGGTFPGKLRALDPLSGADTGYVSFAITGTVAPTAGATDVYRFAVNSAGTRLVAIGNFTAVGGQARSRAFMADLNSASANVSSWYYQPLTNMCAAPTLPQYLRGVDFSPDGGSFYLVSTGFVPQAGGEGRDVCDATARFETAVASPFRPTWLNYTAGDTLHSVVATGAAVYVQGHMRWVDSGATAREGIAAIHPTSGLALPWNPGKTRAVGGKVLYATTAGLWVGSDGARIAGERRDNIAFCPLSGL